MTTPKLCEGCQSYRRNCLIYHIGKHNNPYHKTFREKFCPCVKCIVKPICTDNKVEIIHFIGFKTNDKCKKMRKSIDEFASYLNERGMRQTTLKRKKKRSKKGS